MACANNAFASYDGSTVLLNINQLDCNSFYWDVDTIYIRKAGQYNVNGIAEPESYLVPYNIDLDPNGGIDLLVGGTITDVFTDKTVVWQLQGNLEWLKVEEREVVELIS